MRQLFLYGWILGSFLHGCNYTREPMVNMTSSFPDYFWIDRSDDVELVHSAKADIVIYSDSLRQAIDGFGGCFNEMGWEALSYVSDVQRESIMNSLFDHESGCGFSICRMPIGANDYALNWYSHNETTGDYAMDSFNISRDEKYLIPYIKAALEIRPDLRVWASPWCPPSWMKTNQHYACKSDPVQNDLSPDKSGEELVNQFVMDEITLDAYALYFSNFIQTYRAKGIEIYAVHVQNEPNSCQNFPSCIWRPEALAAFIGKHLGPHFEEIGLDTEIWLGTIERPQPERVDPILRDPDASRYITGVGFQWAGKKLIPYVKNVYPKLPLMQTENECGSGKNDWNDAVYSFGLLCHYMKYGANAYMFWNMVLDETGKSQWGWKQNSMITIDKQFGKIVYNPEYYLMKHFSALVPKGSRYLASSDNHTVAFRTPEGYVIIYYNEDESPREIKFSVNDLTVSARLEAKSFNTIKIREISSES